MHIYVYTHAHYNMCIYIYICVYVYVYVCMYVYMYIYIHTHIHIILFFFSEQRSRRIVHTFLLFWEVDDAANLLVLEPVARCSGGEGTPPESLNGLTCNPLGLHRPGSNPGPSYPSSIP